MPKYNFYAVIKNGVKTIVYNWKECEQLTNGIKGVKFKGFINRQDAEEWNGAYVSTEKRPSFDTPPLRDQYPQQLEAANEKKHAIMYTDAAYISARKFAGVGIYSESFNLREHIQLEFEGTTNQRAELYGVFKAINYYNEHRADFPAGVTVFTDSNWSVNTLTIWPITWERKRKEFNAANPKKEQKEWMTFAGKPVKHLDIIQPTLELINTLRETNSEVNIFWIPRKLNEKADALSRGVMDV